MDAINHFTPANESWQTPLLNWQKSWAGWLILGIGLSLVVFVVIHYLKILDLDQTKIYSDWMQGICAVAATILGWRVTQHGNLKQSTKRAFRLLTLAYFSFAFGALYWVVFNCLLGNQPYLSLGESFADVGFLAMYPFMLWSLLKFPTQQTETLGTRFGLDISIVALGVMTILWHFVVFPSLDNIEDGQWFSTLFKLLYPFGDCCLLIGSFKILRNRVKGASQVALVIFTLGIAVLAFGDIGFNYLSLQKDYQPGHIIESTWFLSLFLFCVSSFYQYEAASRGKNDEEIAVKSRSNWFNSDWIIYLAFFVVSFILLIETVPHWTTSIGFTVFVVFALTTLIIVRQIFAFGENSRLFSLQYKQNSELRFLNLIQNSSDLIFVFDGEGKITYQSPSITRILGYGENSLLKRKWIDFVSSENKDEFQKILQDNFDEKTISEFQFIKADNSTVVLEGIIKSFVNDETGQKGIVLNARDITERKEAERQIHEFNQKLQQSNQELNDFAYVASHDLQEPLRKIQAFGTRLRAKEDKLSDQGKDYLNRMESAASRMQRLIVDLLGFSRLNTQIKPFEMTDLSQIASEVLSDLEVKIEETKAKVTLGKLPVLEAEPTQMRQLIQNLVGNALKFQQRDQLPEIEIYSENADANNIRLIVKDNGIGFEERLLDKIFAVFQRLHGRQEYEGSGVGLAVCRKIAERHGGQITANSSPGNGAKFIVTLPLKQAEN
jgi:PAS domain S-box-containing protein